MLSPLAFRNDPEILAKDGRYKIVVLSESLYSRFFSVFITGNIKIDSTAGSYNLDKDMYGQERKQIRQALGKVLAHLYAITSIKCVISPHARYLRDIEWGFVSEKIGVPYILMLREGRFTASTVHKKRSRGIYKKLGRFEGARIIAQNTEDTNLLVDSGFAERERISVIAPLRMQNFFSSQRLIWPPKLQNMTILVVPYSWQILARTMSKHQSIIDGQFMSLYYGSIGSLAKKHPNIDVIIKLKRSLSPVHKRVISDAMAVAGYDLARLRNIRFEGDLSFHDTLQQSHIVYGLNTTALLEAAVAGRQVILPLFSILGNLFDDLVWFSDDIDCFTVVKEPEQLERTVLNCLENPMVDDELLKLRIELFQKYFAIEHNVIDRTITCIDDCIKNSRSA
jgi:hypothetical protein